MAGSGLQFFATNRAMENLASVAKERPGSEEDNERQIRHGLQKGGYYFVDMDKYMPYFFAEVDNERMPVDAIIQKSDAAVFENFLLKPSVGRVVICVHGFNVFMQAAYTWFRILTDTMRNEGYGDSIVLRADDPRLETAPKGTLTAFIGFSWPSNGSVFAYNRDQQDATLSGQPLAGLIGRIHFHGKPVSLLCHSMGNYVACSMLAGLVSETFTPNCFTVEYLRSKNPNAKPDDLVELADRLIGLIRRGKKLPDESVERDKYFVDDFVMVAPDVERRHVTKGVSDDEKKNYMGPYYSGLQHLVARVTNVYSRFDGALNVSTYEKKTKSAALAVGEALNSITFGLLDFLERNPDYKWEMRLGSSAHPLNAPKNFISINATERAGRPIDHSDHIDSREVTCAIADALRLKRVVAKLV